MAVVSAAGAILLFLVATLAPFTDSGPAAPQAGGYTPRPEWYFQSHFQLLKWAWLPDVVGAFVLPNLVIGGLFLLPFLDRNPERAFGKRKVWNAIGLIGVLAVVGLTAQGIAEEAAEQPATTHEESTDGDPITRGQALFTKMKCIKCHTIQGEGGDKGPDLSNVARRLRGDFFEPWIRNPRVFKPDTEMPSFEGSERELGAITAYLRSLK